MRRCARVSGLCLAAATLVLAGGFRALAQESRPLVESAPVPDAVAKFVKQNCADCHSDDASLALTAMSPAPLGKNSNTWEKVVRKLRTRQMPPVGHARPSEADYEAVLTQLEGSLDRMAEEFPQPGRIETFRRLTRTEYHNAVRDLLHLDVDVTEWIPADQVSRGFDNITVGDLSPTSLERYVTAAQKISRLAVGGVRKTPDGATFRIPPDVTQEEHVSGLPLGTRGGGNFPYVFAQDGEYEFQIRLTRDRNEEVEGLKDSRDSHELVVLIDREQLHSFTVERPQGPNHSLVDAHLKVRLPVKAGRHEIGVTFVKLPLSVAETKREPLESHFNMHRHPRLGPAIYQVSVAGPFDPQGAGETASRQQIFVVHPSSADDETAAAKTIIARLARLAWRRPVSEPEVDKLLAFYQQGRQPGGFDTGIEHALNALLVSPEFLFRVERQPAGARTGGVYRISDLELATRLSFFLWSSIPDDELLKAAESGSLRRPDVLEQQVKRMLADPRAENLATNFTGQWLYLRNLDSFTPEQRLFPDFDDNLRQAMRQETELLFQHVLHNDLNVLDLLRADYTFLNERLAKHYGIPHVYGPRFRQVDLTEDSHRGGLLRQASILTVTSYATRTSPVIRGKWILENLLGSPPPPPPADVPDLKDVTISGKLSVRDRLAEHRANPACAGCHNLMDPVGFSLENFDAIGRWRDKEDGLPVDAAGGTADGARFTGVDGLEASLLAHPDLFVGTLTEKLLTFGLGRGVEPADGPAVRRIVREARGQDFRLSSLVLGIVNSPPFQMRTAQ